MLKIKKNDMVEVSTGKDKGKKGKVLEVFAKSNKALVEGVNLAKKHKRQTRQDQKGGIVSIEMPIAISNLKVICKKCNRGVRIGFSVQKDNEKIRICKACKEVI